jgi:hypothetical protein
MGLLIPGGSALAHPLVQAGNSIHCGDSVSGRATTSSGQRWIFSGSRGDVITIAMNSSSFDTFLELYGPDNALVTSDDDGGPSYNALISYRALPSSGTYTIIARGYNGATGPYTLSLECGASSGSSTGSASLGCGSSVSDYIADAAGDRWTFSGSSGTSVTIALNGTGFDTYLELYSPDGSRLAHDDDGGPDLNSLISAQALPSAGTYVIVARGFSGATGSYTLSLSCSAGTGGGSSGGNRTPAAPTSLSYGSTVTDRVTDATGDRWTFNGSSGDVVTVAMNSAAFDTYLELYRPDGSRLAYDDDSGPGLNSLINGQALPGSGAYTIVARGYNGGTGDYSLTLSRSAAPNSVPVPTTLPPVSFSQAPAIARVAHCVSGQTDTYLILSFRNQGSPDYYYHRVTVAAFGSGARIEQVYPVVGSQLAQHLGRTVTVTLGEAALNLGGVGTVLDIAEAFAEEMERSARTGVRSFSVTWYNTASQPDLDFLLWATHPSDGGLQITTEWARTGSETISSNGPLPICP